MLARIAFLILCMYPAVAQVANVAISEEPANEGVTVLTFLDGSNNPQYICRALSRQPTFTWIVTPVSSNQGTLTNISVAANVGTVTTSAAHGLGVGNLVWVTGSTTAALNGAYIIQTVGSTTTFTITTSGVGDATYSNAALAVNTSAPRTTAAIWSIKRFSYTSSVVTASQWVTAVANNQGASTAKNFICGNRASLAYE